MLKPSKSRAPGLTRRAGFTLLELLVVMVIVGVISTVSVGKIHDVMIQQRVYRAASVVQTNVEAAWSIAARNSRPIRIAWDATNLQLDVTDRAGTTVYRRAGLGTNPYGLASGSVTFSRSPVEVYPNGLANDTLLITMSMSGVTKKIWVSRAGQVQQR
jgi:prepilin-type N-terminal cleavage/methylation domain-containing protein